MITIISPAKSMDFNPEPEGSLSLLGKWRAHSGRNNTHELLAILKGLSAGQIGKIMKVSEKIAKQNHQRFQTYENLPEKPAIFAYVGDVYKKMEPGTFSLEDLEFAQDNLRIISAFYGLVRPMDKIKAYRLEMVNKLPGAPVKSLALMWQEDIAQMINEEIKTHPNKYVINLASDEYSAAIDAASLDAKMVNIHFREIRDGVLRNIAINSKRARGRMAGYIIKGRIGSPEELKSVSALHYAFDAGLSDESNFFFVNS
ncbi:MAG: hypothetical protein COA94_00380 [Rickettsiales bacterium]|nr:MAG: hypothetical protein COA94_00380 [Rickettsiales bacterium]